MNTFEQRRYLLLAQDPVHVGSGGYRLGRVDNSIVREPGSRIPKIPGTSLHGAARAYAARLYETPEAAGQSQDKVDEPEKNPVCYTFGYMKKNENSDDGTSGYSGVVNVFDAQVVLFPVSSRMGPVWVSSAERLKAASFVVNWAGAAPQWPDNDAATNFAVGDARTPDQTLNLGWMVLNVVGTRFTATPPAAWQGAAEWTAAANRLVLVKEKLLGHIINSNLEVRTSVSIDPKTGAAATGLLFTYEALPRGTFLTLDAVIDDYRAGGSLFTPPITTTVNPANTLPGKPWAGPADVFEAGLELIKWLGVGGMGTRGFGRLARVGKPVIEQFGTQEVTQ